MSAATYLIAVTDEELRDWLFGVMAGSPVEAGGFLKCLVEAASRADSENYPLLRPVLLAMRFKYPTYSLRAKGVAVDEHTSSSGPK